MHARTARRVILAAVLLFFLAGLYIVEQRPQGDSGHGLLLTSIHDYMAGPVHPPGPEPQTPKEVQAHEHAHDHHDELDPCTVFSPLKGFIDLRSLAALETRAQPWAARGFDSGRNYTLGICLSPVKRSAAAAAQVRDGLNISQVGAYYIDPDTQEYVLMGQVSGAPVFQGRKLTLTYANGLYCSTRYANGERVRRTTILTLACDREMLTKAHVSYVAAVDDCTYFFEVRSHYACPTAAKADNLAAIWIFLLILLAALMVYFSGGFLYRTLKRTSKPQ